ncbi:MAG: hypothetical protein R3E68_22330 [Burkholderiaceae bacterium]
MTGRLLIGALLATLSFATWHQRQRIDTLEATAMLPASVAPLTPLIGDDPLQHPTDLSAFQFRDHAIRPLAGFAIRARILSREDYRFDAGADLSPIDLALGWRRMADPSVYRQLNIRQHGRWYHYSWSGEPPIPLREIIESSANMHLIPANDAVRRVLERARAGGLVSLRGQLVEAVSNNGRRWRSSLSRADSGDGSCELVFVQHASLD